MPLPTMSLRASPEYHQLIRDVATALRTRPELADVLRDVLQAEDGVAVRDTNVLQSILDRLAALERAMSVGAPSPPDEAGQEQPPLTIEQARAINEMLNDGQPAAEIMRSMGRSIPTREEIKQRLVDEILPPSSTA
jgi:hypothetical protein